MIPNAESAKLSADAAWETKHLEFLKTIGARITEAAGRGEYSVCLEIDDNLSTVSTLPAKSTGPYSWVDNPPAAWLVQKYFEALKYRVSTKRAVFKSPDRNRLGLCDEEFSSNIYLSIGWGK